MTRKRPIDPYLSQHPLFAACSKRQLRELSGLATAVSLRSGRMLGRQGDLSEELVLIERGRVAAEIDGEIVHTFEPGEFVGKTTGHGNLRHTATVYAATDVDAKVISQQELRFMFEVVPSLAEALHLDARPTDDPSNAVRSSVKSNPSENGRWRSIPPGLRTLSPPG